MGAWRDKSGNAEAKLPAVTRATASSCASRRLTSRTSSANARRRGRVRL